jgi:hypothetical protein
LLEENFSVEMITSGKYGWKHWFVEERRLRRWGTKNTLFIVIFRNPYDWLISFNRAAHHASNHRGLSLSDFISKKWEEGAVPRTKGKDVYEMNPQNGLPYENVLDLRTAKIKDFLKLRSLAENVEYVKYEELIANDYQLADDWSIKLKEKYQLESKASQIQIPGSYCNGDSKKGKINIGKHVSTQFYFNPSFSNAINPDLLQDINTKIDWETEKIIGYEKVSASTLQS